MRGVFLLDALIIGTLFGLGCVGYHAGQVLIQDSRVLGVSQQAYVKISGYMLK
jgi:hypothetical protein